LPIGSDKVKETKKSSSPVFNERTLDEYYRYLDANLNRFERRSFEEFSYIKVEPKTHHIIIIYILALIVSVGLNLWLSNNEHNDHSNYRDSNFGKRNKYRTRYY
jgi:hypothetical protein